MTHLSRIDLYNIHSIFSNTDSWIPFMYFTDQGCCGANQIILALDKISYIAYVRIVIPYSVSMHTHL